jgi:uncharacterized protein involved in type VI secretion and phage assembly
VGPPFAGRYLLSTARHEFSADSGYRTSFRVGNGSSGSRYGAPAGGGAAGLRPPVVGSVHPAVVSDTRDPEALGRVRVRLPWLSDSYESAWARTVVPGAAGAFGMRSLPEVGEEVLVAFGDDGLGEPYVLGSLTHAEDGDVTISGANLVLRSRGDLTLEATGSVVIEAQREARMTATGSLDLSSTTSAKLSAAHTEVTGTATTTVKGALVRIN